MTTWTLRITGLGHSLTLEVPGDTTVGGLKQEIQESTGLPPDYQRLIARKTNLEDSTNTLQEAGLQDRTKIMLLHSALYAQEKDGFEALLAIEKEINDLATAATAAGTKEDAMDANAISEHVTRICCKLDAIDTAGSERLRAQRKELLQKAEQIDH